MTLKVIDSSLLFTHCLFVSHDCKEKKIKTLRQLTLSQTSPVLSNPKHQNNQKKGTKRKLHCGNFLDSQVVSCVKLVNEVSVSNARRSTCVELVDGVFYTVTQLLDQVAYDQKACSVVPVVAVNTN